MALNRTSSNLKIEIKKGTAFFHLLLAVSTDISEILPF